MAANFDRIYNVRYNIVADPDQAKLVLENLAKTISGFTLDPVTQAFRQGIGDINAFKNTLAEIGRTEVYAEPLQEQLSNLAKRAKALRESILLTEEDVTKKVAQTQKGTEKATKQQTTAINQQAKATDGAAKAIGNFAINQEQVLSQAEALKKQAQGINSMRRALEKMAALPKKSYTITINAKVDGALRQIDAVWAKLALLKAEAANIFAAPTVKSGGKTSPTGKKSYKAPVTTIKTAAEIVEVIANKKAVQAKPIPVLGEITEIVNALSRIKQEKPITGLLGEITKVINAATKVEQDKPITGLLGEITKIMTAATKVEQEKPITGLLGEITKVINAASKIEQDKPITGLLGEITKVINATTKIEQDKPITGLLGEITKVINAASKIEQDKPITGLVGEITKVINAAKGIEKNKPITGLTGKITKVISSVKSKPSVEVTAFIKSGSAIKIGKDGNGSVKINLKGHLSAKDITVSDALKKNGVKIPITAKFDLPKITSDLNGQLKNIKKLPKIRLEVDTSSIKTAINSIRTELRKAGRIAVTGQQVKPLTTTQERISVVGTGAGTQSVQTSMRGARTSNVGAFVNAKSKPGFSTALYQLTGNTSFGARTPALVDMAKGMGMMMAVGEAMSAVGGAFNQAVQYQNIMETARQIQKNNFGNTPNFDATFERMKNQVRTVGVKTSFTTADAAGAAKYLSMAGLDMETITNSIKPIADVALSGDLNLSTTADKLTNIMTAFKLNGKDIAHLSDVLVNTFTKTNTSMMQLAESSQYAAPLASLYGMPVEEMMALIGVLGDAGIQGSMAGTTLRMMLNNILKPSKNQIGWWEKSGVSRRYGNGKYKPVSAILQEMANKIPEDELIEYIMGEFRVTSAAGAGQLVRSMRKVRDLTESNFAVNGVASNVAEAKMGTIKGLKAQVTSMFVEAITRGMENNKNKISEMLEKLRDLLASPKVMDALGKLIDFIMDIGKFSVKIAGAWVKVYTTAPGLIMTFLKFQFVITQLGYIVAPILSIGKVISHVVTKLWAFGAALKGIGGASVGSSAALRAGGLISGLGLIQRGGGAAAVKSGQGLTNAGLAAMMAAQGYGYTQFRGSFNTNALRQYGRANHTPIYSQYQPWRTAANAAMFNAMYLPMQTHWDRLLQKYDFAGAKAAYQRKQFYQSYNAQRKFGGASALLLGNNPTIRHAAEYEARYARYNNLLMGMTAAQLATPVGQKALRNAEIYQRGVMHSETVRARAARIYGWRNVTGRAISNGWSKGLAMGTLALSLPKLSSVGSVITAILGKLATAFGALLSPIGLATMAIGALGFAMWKSYKIQKQRAQEYDQAKKISRDFYDKNGMTVINGMGRNAAYGVLNLEDNKDLINRTIQNNLTGRDTRGIIYFRLSRTKMLNELYKSDNGAENYDKGKDLYDKYIKPYSNRPYSDYIKQYTNTSNWGAVSPYTSNWKAITKKPVDIVKLKNDAIVNAITEYIPNLSEMKRAMTEMSGIVSNNKNKGKDWINDELAKVVSRYANYSKLPKLMDIDGVREGTATWEVAMQSYEGQQRAFEYLSALQTNLIQMIDDGTVSLTTILSNMQLQATDLTGKVAKFYLPIGSDFTVDWQRLMEQLALFGYKFNSDVATTADWIAQIYRMLKTLPEGASITLEKLTQVMGGVGKDVSLGKNGAGIMGNFVKQNAPGISVSSDDSKMMADYYESMRKAGAFNNPNMTLGMAMRMPMIGGGGINSFKFKKMMQMIGVNETTTVGEFQQKIQGSMAKTNLDMFGDGTNKQQPSQFSTPTMPKYNIPQGNTYSPKVDNDKYKSNYSRNTAQPRQVIVNIDNMARFNNLAVAGDAESREIAQAMEQKIGQAMSMLTSQIAAQLSTVGNIDGDYIA